MKKQFSVDTSAEKQVAKRLTTGLGSRIDAPRGKEISVRYESAQESREREEHTE